MCPGWTHLLSPVDYYIGNGFVLVDIVINMVDKGRSCALAQISFRGGLGKSTDFNAGVNSDVLIAGACVIFGGEVDLVPGLDADEPGLRVFVCVSCEPYDLALPV